MITKHILYGMKLWAFQLIPSLFPFMILTKLFLWFQNQHRKETKTFSFCTFLCRLWNLSPSGFYILILGHICGYPTGAQMISDQFKQQRLTKKEADYLMTLCNQSSPAFIMSYFISYALQQPEHTWNYVFLLYISTFFTSLFTRQIYNSNKYSKSENNTQISQNASSISMLKHTSTKHNSPKHNSMLTADNKRITTTNTAKSFFDALDDSIQSSCFICIKIGGYIIFFSALAALSMQILSSVKPYHIWITSILELTYGLSLLKEITFQYAFQKKISLLGCFSFGGLCTMAQIKGMLAGTSLSIKPYIVGKCIYTFIVLTLYTLVQLII